MKQWLSKIILATDTVDRDGESINIEGCDITDFQKNPVLLNQHKRGEILGLFINVRKENNSIVADGINFSENLPSHLEHIPKQIMEGVRKAYSIGLLVYDIVNDNYLVRSAAYEGSSVDIGSNPDTLGKAAYYNKEGEQVLLKTFGTTKTVNTVDFKEIAKSLGLSESATKEQILAKIAEINNETTRLKTVEAGVKPFKDLVKKTLGGGDAFFDELFEADPNLAFKYLEKTKAAEPATTTKAAAGDDDSKQTVKNAGLLDATNFLKMMQANGGAVAEEKDWDWYQEKEERQKALADLEESDFPAFAKIYEKKFNVKPKKQD